MIMGVMIVVIHGVIVLNPLSVSITAVCGSKSAHKLHSPPDSLITVKRKSIHIRFSLCLCSLNRARQSGEGKFMLCLVGHQGPHVWIDSLPFRFRKTQVSVELRMGNSSFKFKQCAFDVLLARQRRPGVAGVCRWAHWPLSRHKICLLYLSSVPFLFLSICLPDSWQPKAKDWSAL